MKISELRPIIKDYDKSKLERIIIELYKRVPKNIKEDYDIDNYIKNINNEDKIKSNKKEDIDLKQLKDEIIYFLTCVDNGFYHIPNKVISKKERSKWRFKVKKFYKSLTSIDPTYIDGDNATFLLIEIFEKLSEGTAYLLFSNWEPFKAIGVSQADYFIEILDRTFKNKVTSTEYKILTIINLLNVDTESEYYENLYTIYSNYINDKDEINLSIKFSIDKIEELKEKYKTIENDNKKYYLSRDINDYCRLITNLYIKLNQVEKGIDFYYKNVIDMRELSKVYNILDILKYYKLYDEWIKEYEKKSSLGFHDYVKEEYLQIKDILND